VRRAGGTVHRRAAIIGLGITADIKRPATTALVAMKRAKRMRWRLPPASSGANARGLPIVPFQPGQYEPYDCLTIRLLHNLPLHSSSGVPASSTRGTQGE
jgi:hypothetical protein